MAITQTEYGTLKMACLNGDAPDLLTDDIAVVLLTSSYTPDFHGTTGDEFLDDVSASEVANGDGYTTGGQTLASKTVTWDDANSAAVFDVANTSWTFTASKTFGYAVVYQDTGTPGTSRLLTCIDFGGDRVEASDFVLVWSSTNGVYRLR